MKEQAKAVRYTIRGIPAEVDRILREKAVRRKQSLNQVILDELSRAVTCSAQRADFRDLVGQWTPDPQFDEIVKSQRLVDRDKWN